MQITTVSNGGDLVDTNYFVVNSELLTVDPVAIDDP